MTTSQKINEKVLNGLDKQFRISVTSDLADKVGIKKKRLARLLYGTAQSVLADEVIKIEQFFKVKIGD